MAAARFEQSGFSPYEGMLGREANVRRTGERIPPRHPIQPRRTGFRGPTPPCRFRFLLSQVLKIEPLPSIETEIDARERGLTLHGILRQLHSPAKLECLRPEIPSGVEIGGLLRDLAERNFPISEECAGFERAVQTVERRFADLFAEWYAAQWDAYHEAIGQGVGCVAVAAIRRASLRRRSFARTSAAPTRTAVCHVRHGL